MFEKKFNTYTPAGYPPDKYDVLEEHHDVFKKELSINSYHVGEYVVHGNVPLDVVYKSNPAKEAFYLTYVYYVGKEIPAYLRLNIDGRENIEIEVDDSLKDNINDYQGSGNRVYFEITKEQLYKLCLANSLAVQISNHYDSVIKECTANGFIAVLQTLYNRAIDNNTFYDAKERCIAFFEEEASKKNAKDEEEEKMRKRSKTAWIVIGILLALIGIIILSAVGSGSFVAILFSILLLSTGFGLFLGGLLK